VFSLFLLKKAVSALCRGGLFLQDENPLRLTAFASSPEGGSFIGTPSGVTERGLTPTTKNNKSFLAFCNIPADRFVSEV
jgi:hypothetical protein